jgi:hypothetical protein
MTEREELIAEAVAEIVPKIYFETEALLTKKGGVGLYNDPSHSNLCAPMTLTLFKELQARNLPARREFHCTPYFIGAFLIAHSDIDKKPSIDDVVTDLNPWESGPSNKTGYIHSARSEVISEMSAAGAPGIISELRSVESIVLIHTVALTPKDALLEFARLEVQRKQKRTR